ncbi:class I SAM-dependent methyltransferase [Pseudomonas citronellolis]|uniref:class I SAM-dependent methyltransferase n=1 Tax=Pseudomonas citronellolis TaxID=53408 RepID=UPI0007188108|nr:methyltransferase domain-containing protein [Pseudomonas citronellolis]KRV73432.1 hypothetical protein AO742_04205 [Pseudomonas citronellolis]KRW79330.1 hypothetical protein AO738_28115 [Pseudomonas citronellolis]
MDFRQKIVSIAQDKSRILEVGPSYNPILPKSKGFNVFIVDHADQETLVRKYQAYGVDTSSIEPVDFITTDLASLQAEGHRFDLIVASHVIEHSTDLIKFLNDCSSLLAEDGTLALLVPDKRYCFDTFRPLSSPGAAINAHYNKQSRHIGGLLDHYTYFTRNDGKMAWGDQDELTLSAIHSADICRNTLRQCLASSDYMDAHEWTFTPTSFRFMIQELVSYDLVDIRISEYHDTLGYEFFALLSRNTALPESDKFELLEEIRQEEFSVTPAAKAIREAAALLDVRADNLESMASLVVQRLCHLQSTAQRRRWPAFLGRVLRFAR